MRAIAALVARTGLLLLLLSGSRGLPQDVGSVGPVVISQTPAPGFINSLTTITVTFDRPVVGVAASQFLLNGSPAQSVSGTGAAYTFTFSQPAFGPVDVTWGPLHQIYDTAVPPNRFAQTAPGAAWSYQLTDPAGPRLVGRLPSAGVTLRRLSEVEVRFALPVRNVAARALRLNGVPALTVTGVGAGPYRFRFPDAPAGSVDVTWATDHGIESDEETPLPFHAVGWNYFVEPTRPAPDVVISELLAENDGSLRDEDGDVEDWLELHNRGSQSVNLAGWALGVSGASEESWTMPSLILPAGQRIYLWCSAKDRTDVSGGRRLHTDFKLNATGDTLRLYGPELPRTLVDSVAFPEQYPDYSYGREGSGTGATAVWRYFAKGTPGTANGVSTITGKVDEVHFSVERGFYNLPFNLSLATVTPGAVIRYTTNGSPPSVTNGVTYTSPLPINSTRVIRAAAFGPAAGTSSNTLLPSLIRTHTYLFNIPASRRLIPSLSLVTGTNNLYGRTGIMESSPRNTDKHGKAWERPVSAELIRPEDNGGFQLDCGVRVAGGDYIRGLYNYRSANPPEGKYSYRLYFRGEYGPGHLDYPIFPGTTVRIFDALHLRAGMNDPVNPLMRDEFVRATTLDMGITACRGTFLHLFLNGVYKGIYNPCERVESDFLQQYEGQSASWDVVGANNLLIDGDSLAWNKLRTDVRKDLTVRTNYLNVANQMDLQNFVDYLLPPIWSDNDDWPHNNTRAARPRIPGGKFRFYPWDAEFSFGGQVSRDTIANQLSTLSPPWGTTDYQQIFNALKKSPEFRLLFADRIHRAFSLPDAPLSTNRLRVRYEAMKAGIAPSITGFDNVIGTWINSRHRYLTNMFIKAGFYASSNAPTPNRFGGRVPRGFALTLTNRTGDIWVTTDGTDPRVPFLSTVSARAQAYAAPLVVTEPTRVLARSLSGTNWSAVLDITFEVAQLGVPVHFSELNYHPPGGDAYEFIELQNTGPVPIDLSGYSFQGINYRFPTQSPVLGAGARLVVANTAGQAALFATRDPGVKVFGWYEGSLANGGERVALLDPRGEVVESVEYNNRPPWPVTAAGLNATLERLNPAAEGSDPAGWRASVRLGGSPGTPDDPTARPSVRINEINAAVTGDWLEVHNTGTNGVDLGGWSLTDFSGVPALIFPPQTKLAAGGFMTIDADGRTNRAGLHAAFTLNRDGETLGLYDATGQAVDLVTYGSMLTGFTLGHPGDAGDSWTLTQPTRGLANVVVELAPMTALSLNEFLANPLTGDDLVEFHNASSLPASLTGCYLATSNSLARILPPTFVPAAGFIVLRADGNPGPGHLGLKLPAAGDRLIFYDAEGNELNRVTYPKQLEGVTYGRIPDATGPFRPLPFSESLGASNYLAELGSRLRFTEFMAGSTISNITRGHWIELENRTTGEIDLGGYNLRVDPGHGATSVGFGVGDLVVAGGRVVKAVALPATGAVVTLLDPRGQVLDRLEYGAQLPGRSVGRTDGEWQLQSIATPGTTNAAPAQLADGTAVRFNEWLTGALNGADDFVELYNPALDPVDVGGWVLTDDLSLSGLTRTPLTPLNFIAPGGFLRLRADGNTDSGAEHLAFKLDGLGESLRLLNQGRVIDAVDYLVQTDGVSEGRYPDGASRILRFPGTPTPAGANRRAPLDDDHDGLDDTWEVLNGLNPGLAVDADADADGDGFSNRQEYLAGTDPQNPNSKLALAVDRPNGPGFTLRFTAQPGHSYLVQFQDDPAAGWKRLSDIPAGAGAERAVTVEDPTPIAEHAVRLYRIQATVVP